MEKGILKHFNTVYKTFTKAYKLKVDTYLKLAKMKKTPQEIFKDLVNDLSLFATKEKAYEILKSLDGIKFKDLREAKVMAFSSILLTLGKNDFEKENILKYSKIREDDISILFKLAKKFVNVYAKEEKTTDDLTNIFLTEEDIFRKIDQLTQ